MPEALWASQVQDKQHSAHHSEWKGAIVRDFRHSPVAFAAYQLNQCRYKVEPCRQATEEKIPHQPPFPFRRHSDTCHESCSSPRRRNEIRAARPSKMALPRLTSDEARTERDGNCGLRGRP